MNEVLKFMHNLIVLKRLDGFLNCIHHETKLSIVKLMLHSSANIVDGFLDRSVFKVR